MKRKALIIGAAGFVGGYLIKELVNQDYDVYSTKLPNMDWSNDLSKVVDLDILNKDSIVKLFLEIKPDVIFHLAAQSSVALSWKNPGLTVDINIKGSINVMDALRELPYSPRALFIGSGEEYGYIHEDETPITEENALRPGNIYAATKVCQNMIGHIYVEAYGLNIILVRAFNHIGPEQAPLFVVSDFCKQVAEIEAGKQEPVIKVGNLSARRDFTDVRDVVKAYVKLVEEGVPGETYNVGRGEAIAINDLLQMIISKSKVDIQVEVDQNKLRPVDVPEICADTTKIHELTGWKPEISLEQTIEETLEYWRKQKVNA